MTQNGPSPLLDAVGFVDLSARGKLELQGDDAVTILHKFCTNDIQNLAVGAGCEAFVLDAKGHIQFYVIVHRLADRLLLETLADAADTEAAARLAKFIDRYVIREKVKFIDRTTVWAELLIAGNEAGSVVRRALSITVPEQMLEQRALALAGESAFVVRSVQTKAPNYTLFCPLPVAAEAKRLLREAGCIEADYGAYDVMRIEAGLPLTGRDISEKALPQEIDRNEQTINFRKGCYLGQETVARLDAIGHVNKTLVRLKLKTDANTGGSPLTPPAAGTELRAGEQIVGTITSAACTSRGEIVALGIVRAGHNQPRSILTIAQCGPMIVVGHGS